LRHHPGIEVSLAFSLDPAPFGLWFGVRAIPAVLVRAVWVLPQGFAPDSNQPALLTRRSSPSVSIRLARRHFLPDSSRTRRSPFPLAGFRLRFVRSFGISHRVLSAHVYIHRSSTGSSRFLPASHPAASNRLFRTYCLRRELLSAFKVNSFSSRHARLEHGIRITA